MGDPSRARAYLLDLPSCQEPGCIKPAVVELRNSVNASLGRYCRPHGNAKLARFKAGG